MSSVYDHLGGETTLRALATRFYHHMDNLPSAKGIRAMHPHDIAHSTEKLYLFLSGWLGGPPLYVERFGHPYLRARHLPFNIGVAERDAWLLCMEHALEDCVPDLALRRSLQEAFFGLADHMRNRTESPATPDQTV